jgi:hypothetical protein
MPRRTLTVEQRFWAKVHKGDVCWNWTAARTSAGYSWFYDGDAMILGHRFVYELLVEPIPTGMVIDHLCRNRRCVNPEHLEVVTHAENVQRGVPRKRYCPNGHEWTPETTYHPPSAPQRRLCKPCMRARERARYLAVRLSVK